MTFWHLKEEEKKQAFWAYRFDFFVLLKNCVELGNCDFDVFLHRLWSKICSRILDDMGNFHNVHEKSFQRYQMFIIFVFFTPSKSVLNKLPVFWVESSRSWIAENGGFTLPKLYLSNGPRGRGVFVGEDVDVVDGSQEGLELCRLPSSLLITEKLAETSLSFGLELRQAAEDCLVGFLIKKKTQVEQ